MPKVSRWGHVGIYVTDLQASKDFYTRLFGFQVTDEQHGEDLKIVFLTLEPQADHHQLVLMAGRNVDRSAKVINQLSMHVESLADLRQYRRIFDEENITITRTITHGISVSIYFLDPDGNQCEVYVETPWYTPQPLIVPVNLDRPDAEIWREVEELCRARPGFMSFADWKARAEAVHQSAVSGS